VIHPDPGPTPPGPPTPSPAPDPNCGGKIPACCSAPTVEQCQNIDYFDACPNWGCNTLLSNSLASYAQSLPQSRMALAPDGTNHSGTQVSTPYVKYDYVAANAKLVGVSSNYVGSPLNHTAWVLNPTQNGRLQVSWANGHFVFRYVDPHAGWDSDGTRVSSCEEYVFKRYTTLSKLEHDIANFGTDWMGALRKMMSNYDFALQSVVKDEQGNVVENLSYPSHLANLFLTFPYYNLPMGTFQFDPQVDTLFKYLNQGWYGGTTPQPSDWSTLWGQVNNQISTFGEDLIEVRYLEMKAFQKLVDSRAQIWTDFQNWWQQNACDGAVPPQRLACDWKKYLTQGYLYNVDAQVNQALLKAITTPNEDCFSSAGAPTACTMSPHQALDEYLGQVQLQRERDYDECVRLTGNRFDSASLVAQANAGYLSSGGVPGGDYTANSAALKGLFGLLGAAIQNLQLPLDPATGKVLIGDRWSDSGHFGNNWFGADYSYEAGWQLSDLAKNICDANLHTKGLVTANADVLGQKASLVDFLAQLDTAEPAPSQVSIHYQTHFRLLGSDIYQPVDNTSPAQFDLTIGATDRSGTLFSSPPIVIPVGPITVNVSGGVAGGVGFTSTLGGSFARDCNANTITASATGAFTPYAHLDAFAQASLGIPSVLEAGIRGNLTLVRIDLPFTSGVGVAWNNATGLTLNGSSNLDLRLSSFGGKIAVFLDSLLYSTEMSLIEWPGVTSNMNLFHLDFSQNLNLMKLGVLARGGEDGNVL
jgi:hypothetical protein